MAKKLVITVLALLFVIALLGGTKFAQFATMKAAGKAAVPPKDAVTTWIAKRDQWRPVFTAVGSVTAVEGVTVSAQLAGNVAKVCFDSGSIVKAGDLLIQLDTTVEEAQLRAAEAAVALARISLDRARDLLAKNSISQAELDTADAQYKQAVAQADNIRAVIAKKTVRAPFSGRLGIRQVNLGQTLKEGDAIVSLQSLDPVYVNFSLPQENLSAVAVGQEISVASDIDPGHPRVGKVTALAAEVDVATRNVKIQGTLENKDGALRPGMFVNLSVFENKSRSVIAIPATAVVYAAYGDSVYVIEKDKDGQPIAHQHFVQLGETRGDFVEIVKGINEGDEVVTNGAFKLRNGSAVFIDNSQAPAVSLNPKPANS